jgi:hypothetical protein
MGQREDDLDAELAELLETDESPDVAAPVSLDDRERAPPVDGSHPGLERGDRTPAVDAPRDARDATESAASGGGRLRSWLGGLFSPRWFGAAAVASGVGVLAAGAVSLPFSGYLGMFLAGAVVGLASGTRRYLEVATAGALAAGLATLLDAIGLVLVGVGLPLVAVAAVSGALIGAIGHYAGRDLRHGLTRELPGYG